ncbi:hypothetical protein J437_LFUL016038 [Ladona fulva]|uniref:Uncharacterized protein n=1 Tax=Ladona fulva TaxID=123851 RepID=A0A8K0KL81_LADFU|nr:hypothetical protein J437_LFUL016038 [Ladona fulva]
MEGKEAAAGTQEEAPRRRIPLESLSKEEIIKKYKNLLVIAQKAKEAKDEANEEMKTMKEKLNALQNNGSIKNRERNGEEFSKENQMEKQINAMQELISNLTDQKLQFAMEMDAVKKKTVKFEEELVQMRTKEAQLKTRVEELEIERDGFERQARRLEKEAESLTVALDETERESSQALMAAKSENETLRKELESLKPKLDDSAGSSPAEESSSLKEQLDNQMEQYGSLQKEVNLFISLLKGEVQPSEVGSSFKSLKSALSTFTNLQQHYTKTKEEVDRLSKVEDESRAVFKEIERLKEQANAGILAQNQLRELSEEKEVLASQVQSLRAALSVYNDCQAMLTAAQDENKLLSSKLQDLSKQSESRSDAEKLLIEIERELSAHVNRTENENLSVAEMVKKLLESISDAKSCEEKLALALSENSSLLNDLGETKKEYEFCLGELNKLKSQCEEFEHKISETDAVCAKLKDELVKKSQENEKLIGDIKNCEQLMVEGGEFKDKYLETVEEKRVLEEKMENLLSSLAKDNVEKEQLLKITSERDDYFNQVKSLQEEIKSQKDTKEKLNAIEAEKLSLKERVEELEANEKDLKKKISTGQKELEDVTKKLKAMESEMAAYRICKETLESEKVALTSDNQSLKEENNVALKEKEKLEKDIRSQKAELEKSWEQRLREIESDRQAVIAELEKLRLQLSESDGIRDDLRNQNEVLKGVLASLEERLRVSEEGAEGAREALENKVNSLQSMVREKEALESELQTLRETLARLEDIGREMEDSKNMLEGENRSLRESLKEQNKVLERLQEVEEGKDGMEREIEALRASLKEETAVKSRIEVEKLSLEKEVSTLRTTVKDEDKVIERLREVEEEKDAMEREIETLRMTVKEESKVREVLRKMQEEKNDLEKELEAVKVGELKLKENLHVAMERSALLEKEVEDLKGTLKEECGARKEIMTQKKELEEEVKSLKASRAELSRLEGCMKKVLEEKEHLLKTRMEFLKQSELFEEQLKSTEDEKALLKASLKEVEGLVGNFGSLVKKLQNVNSLRKILTDEGDTSEKKDLDISEDIIRGLAKDIESFLSASSPNQSHSFERVHQLLKTAISEFEQVNVKSDEALCRFKKLDDDKSKVKKDLEKKLLRLKSQYEEFKKKMECDKNELMKAIDAIHVAIGLNPLSLNAVSLQETLPEVVRNVEKHTRELMDQKQRIEQVIKGNEDELKAALQEKERLEGVVCDIEGELKAAKDLANELEKKIKELEEAKLNSEQQFIEEMKGVNDVLKKRGEVIASLEEKVGKLSAQLLEEQKAVKQGAKLDEAAKEGKLNQDCVDDNLKAAERRVVELEEECKSLRMRISDMEKQAAKGLGMADTAGSEVLSTSTISKAEEMSRLKDLEESFEDRYTKLRTVAVKLKRRCTELEGERKRADELQGRVNSLTKELNNLSMQAKNAQSLQMECDRLQDKVDELSKELNMSKKALKESVDECAAFKIQMITKEKAALESSLREANSRAQSLRKEADSEQSQRKNVEKEVQRLEQELSAAKTKISQEEAKCADALKQLEQGKQTWKRGNVLSLEMDALEQSAADLRRQLEESKEEGKQLKESLSQAEAELEKSKIKEQEAESNKKLLKQTEEKLLETEKIKSEAEGNVERLRREVETQSLQLVKLMAETKRQSDSFRTQQEAVLAQASVLENQVTRLRTELVERNSELEQVRTDFAAYKVRAQAVLLRKEQEREAESGGGASRRDKEEEEAKQLEWDRERQQLERTADGLRRTLEDITAQLEVVRSEKESIEEKCHVLDSECHRLREFSRHAEDQHREDTRQARLQSETLIRSYKQQLEDLQERYRTDTLSLREQVQKLKDEKEQAIQQASVESVKRNRTSEDHGRSHSVPWASGAEGTVASPDGRSISEMALHPREEGEGSESVDSPPSPHSSFNSRGKLGPGGRRKKKGLVPLDQLLSSALPDEEEADPDNETFHGDEDDSSVGDCKEEDFYFRITFKMWMSNMFLRHARNISL